MSKTPNEVVAHGASVAGPAAWSNMGLPNWLTTLAQEGLIASEIAQTAWREAGEDPRSAGQWLLDHGCLAERDLVLAQAAGFGLPFLDPGEYRVNMENRALVPEELSRAQNVFPVFSSDRIITLAVAWPLDLTVLDQIRLHTGCEVDQCLAGTRDLRNLIEWAYGSFQKEEKTRSADAIAWEDILKDVADAPAVKLVNVLLDKAAAGSASDIHIDPEEQSLRVRFRIDGVLREVPAPPRGLLAAIVSRIKIMAHMDIAESRKPQDGHFKLAIEREEMDVRVSTLPSAYGEAVVMRLLHSGGHLLTLDELGMDPVDQEAFDRLIRLPHGMLLVTGPTGSGKTTTLYSALTRIDRQRKSIITLEDPVEIRLQQIRQVSVNPKAGLSFQTGLRSILRQDPDVILVGEIRDTETAEIALQAALTGHLLLSTLHTNSAAAVPARLMDMGVQDFLVSSALVGVLAQRLCRRICRHCAAPVEKPESILALLPKNTARALEAGLHASGGEGRLMQTIGCKRCGNTGFDGRVGIYELLIVTDDMRRAILARKDERTLVDLARANRMRLLVEDGLYKVRNGMTTVQELLRVAGGVDVGPEAARTLFTPEAVAARSATRFQAAENQEETAENRAGRPGFDVHEYERLLNSWLGSEPGESRPVPVSGVVRGSEN